MARAKKAAGAGAVVPAAAEAQAAPAEAGGAAEVTPPAAPEQPPAGPPAAEAAQPPESPPEAPKPRARAAVRAAAAPDPIPPTVVETPPPAGPVAPRRGDTVDYRDSAGREFAAIVTTVGTELQAVDLAVFHDRMTDDQGRLGVTRFKHGVPFSAEIAPHTWGYRSS